MSPYISIERVVILAHDGLINVEIRCRVPLESRERNAVHGEIRFQDKIY